MTNPDAPLVLHAGHSHLYPGARGRVEGVVRCGPCLIVLTDGMQAGGRLVEGGRLEVDAHVTAAGTRIAPKAWQLEIGARAFRVARRLD